MGTLQWPVVIDVAFFVFGLGVIYRAVSRGIISEVFKIAGLLLGTVLAFHYYPFLGDAVGVRASFVNKRFAYAVAFIAIFLATGLVFHLARLIVTLLFKREGIPVVERWACLGTGLIRAALMGSVASFLMYLVSQEPSSLSKTISYRIVKNIGPKFYTSACTLYQHFDSTVSANMAVQEYGRDANTGPESALPDAAQQKSKE